MMYGRTGLDRFKKAQSLEPFAVSVSSGSKSTSRPETKSVLNLQHQTAQYQNQSHVSQKPAAGQDAAPLVGQSQPVTQVGGGQSTWQPPDWAIEPRAGVYFLEVMKDGEVLDRINLDRRRHIFGRQSHTCDFVLDHQSVSRQHAAVIPHKNGSIYVIDLGSAHGTFVANERLTKDTPVELEAGQSLRFAASTRIYILRKNNAALFPRPPLSTEINLPPPPDPSDEEAVVAYNTLLNRYGISRADTLPKSRVTGSSACGTDGSHNLERAAKRIKKARVVFRDHVGGELEEVVGVSDGAGVETEPGPIGVKEGSLVGKYESLVQITVIPKGKEQNFAKEDNYSQKGVTGKLQEVLNKVKTAPKSGIYDDLYGESFAGKVGSSWAYSSVSSSGRPASPTKDTAEKSSSVKPGANSSHVDDDDDDLFGD
ncbi:protein phosphatase 1 regulatory inhibitor subunit PPP1R8 homolog [Humulus lupulus]|uniref:protein phosphatase 1 regulatory inhibitor subunit PPP1R8 homolog n=1 Tax=Humulus lupulus TaxID=3486 RepID=UPI002B404FFE|nr:protein phosphatase 1 regulatory inhibitor subunit PPP1R8 homolog [Humulus lupulus]XP_062088050.1 protein phosphatase 1 regulatory inhibitor subunit PPP1R8 homolog [Humulus lupulus]XP_062088051.1 protein phosphatase 1 regulatory inhibitor subunit PPP1R8 homolog [Humulus lupulus]XP_062088052.1 protein phosphatase 1 regulatory inhibitor subunit PPP1R8 homolog [Humulus lupulus]XP_062088053.1 protein phosphatase 1 regulatory inhibitor subunit PPP1R8 homolog [Humulus lupulus]XP_062088054.1 prote